MDNFPTGTVLLNSADILKRVGVDFGMTVGDFGSGGAGTFTLQSAHLVGDKGKVYAVDILKSALSSVLSKARMAGLINVYTVWSNLEIFGATKAIKDGTIDFGILANTLHQTDKPAEVIKETVRMLKNNAKLLVLDWKTGQVSFGPSDKQLILPARVRVYAQKAGLKEIKAFEAGPYHYGLLLEKTTGK
ncbi:MAG: methyltransferase domain-containing protein [bacterium]